MANEADTSIRVIPVARGWYQVWNGTQLIAKCPSKHSATLIIRAIHAQEMLSLALGRIDLLEQTLSMQLKQESFWVGIFRGKHG